MYIFERKQRRQICKSCAGQTRPIGECSILIAITFSVCLFVCLMVLNATFNNISIISWRSVLLEETGGPGQSYRPVANYWQTLLHEYSNSQHQWWYALMAYVAVNPTLSYDHDHDGRHIVCVLCLVSLEIMIEVCLLILLWSTLFTILWEHALINTQRWFHLHTWLTCSIKHIHYSAQYWLSLWTVHFWLPLFELDTK
jgi:hypothetical protein